MLRDLDAKQRQVGVVGRAYSLFGVKRFFLSFNKHITSHLMICPSSPNAKYLYDIYYFLSVLVW